VSDLAKNARSLFSQAVQKVEVVNNQPNVNPDIKVLLSELVTACQTFDAAIKQGVGSSADSSYIKRKMDQVVKDARGNEIKLEEAKKSLATIVEQIKVIAAEAGAILKRHDHSLENEDVMSAAKIKLAAQKMVESLTNLPG
jgi:hypothetical protein